MVSSARVVLRPATRSDAGGIRALFARLGDDAIRSRFFGGFVDFADEAEHEGLVAVEGEVVVGHAAIRRVGPAAAEFAVAVDPARRRAGVGAGLVRGLADQARDDGVALLLAEVRPGNAAMLALLAGLGLPVRVREAGDRVRVEVAV